MFVSPGVLLATVQDTFGACASGALEIEEVITDNEGFVRWYVDLLTHMQDGKGMGLGGSVFAGTNAIKHQVMNAADPLYTVESVAGDNAESSVLIL